MPTVVLVRCIVADSADCGSNYKNDCERSRIWTANKPPERLYIRCICGIRKDYNDRNHAFWTDSTTAKFMLEELKKPWSAASITENQKQRRDDVARAKSIWGGVLIDFREKKAKRNGKAAPGGNDSSGNEEANSVKDPFPSLDLPGEIRNTI
jgi:hypothetical protein